MLCSLLKFIKVYSIMTALYHTDGTMYVNKHTNSPVALNMKYHDYSNKNNDVYNKNNVYNVTIIHDNRYSECFYNNINKYNYIAYDKGQNPDVNKDIFNEIHKLEENHNKLKIECKTSDWGSWSECSNMCVSYRTRVVIQSGINCPQLTEMKKCCDEHKEHNDDDEEDEHKDDENDNKQDKDEKKHLRFHIRKWFHDPEPDDEEDRKHIRHVFRRYKQLKYNK